MINRLTLTFFAFTLITSCGGGGSKKDAPIVITPPAPLPTSFSIGGAITGVLLESITLLNNDSDELVINDSGTFEFPSLADNGSSYNITVINESLDQDCIVTNANGTVSDNNIENIEVSCTNIPVSSDGFGYEISTKSSAHQ